jgi:hypothetical protein
MEVAGPQPQKPSYSKEFKKSVDLFEKSFKGLEASKFDAQKAQYVKVMKETLSTMQEAANGMFNQHLVELKEKLAQDLNTYLATPNDANREQVEEDINTLKKEEVK